MSSKVSPHCVEVSWPGESSTTIANRIPAASTTARASVAMRENRITNSPMLAGAPRRYLIHTTAANATTPPTQTDPAPT
ncbi:MAG: hypothetical protein R2705_15390 [Ilumatobacteraceae bacterium]